MLASHTVHTLFQEIFPFDSIYFQELIKSIYLIF